jgi:hypothetical protein
VVATKGRTIADTFHCSHWLEARKYLEHAQASSIELNGRIGRSSSRKFEYRWSAVSPSMRV